MSRSRIKSTDNKVTREEEGVSSIDIRDPSFSGALLSPTLCRPLTLAVPSTGEGCHKAPTALGEEQTEAETGLLAAQALRPTGEPGLFPESPQRLSPQAPDLSHRTAVVM